MGKQVSIAAQSRGPTARRRSHLTVVKHAKCLVHIPQDCGTETLDSGSTELPFPMAFRSPRMARQERMEPASSPGSQQQGKGGGNRHRTAGCELGAPVARHLDAAKKCRYRNWHSAA